MSRLDTMARFAEPDNKEPEVIGQCRDCFEDIVAGQEVYAHDGYLYCDETCLFSDLDIYKITVGE
ncbi:MULTISPECIES: hypothetical protein [Bacillus subtilis group]|uniref:hypothetical protein n=1 Tax=Bacillus TaxID=1386 RepID=UPI0011BD9C59|nr:MULTISPECIES: hypothetical protein [Bacillus subtilis group]UAY71966.1 hypothetical protein K8336_07975 [Bacillus paralicheniformis]